MKNIKVKAILIVLGLIVALASTSSALSQENKETKTEKQQILKELQEKFQRTFQQMQVIGFEESPIPSVYELITGERLFYYYPEKELIIFGEIYTKDGRSLTQEKIALTRSKILKDINFDSAVTLGTGSKTIIEFSDPDCVFCQKMHHHFMLMDKSSYQRKVIFIPLDTINPNAHKKAIHILCSANKEVAFNAVYAKIIEHKDMIDCTEGRKILKQHRAIGKKIGIQSTPTIIMDNHITPGFNAKKIQDFLSE